MHGLGQSRPISVHRFYWLGDSVAWDHDAARCDCDKKPIHVTVDRKNFLPHPNRFHHLNYRNISLDLDRNVRIPVSIFYQNVKHRTVERYSYAWAPTEKEKEGKHWNEFSVFYMPNCVHTVRSRMCVSLFKQYILWVSKSPWVLMMVHLLHLHRVWLFLMPQFPMCLDFFL